MILTENKYPEKTEESMASGSLKDASGSGVLMDSVKGESRPYSESATAWSKNRILLIP